VELENGDEEEAFSSVHRPDRRGPGGRERESPGDDKNSTYVPPGEDSLVMKMVIRNCSVSNFKKLCFV
jgi:hypothetical protein